MKMNVCFSKPEDNIFINRVFTVVNIGEAHEVFNNLLHNYLRVHKGFDTLSITALGRTEIYEEYEEIDFFERGQPWLPK